MDPAPAPASPATGRARVVVSSVFYPVGVSRYLERALRRLRDAEGRPLEVLSVGPTTGAGIPWGPQYRFPRYAFMPTHRLPLEPREARVRLQRLLAGSRGAAPAVADVDLWIDVDDGYFVHRPVPARHRAILLTDPHVRPYTEERAFAAGFGDEVEVYSMQSPYRKAGERVLGYGFDEEAHFEEPRGHYGYDVTILGAQYPAREKLAQALKARGIRVLHRMGDLFDECRVSTLAAPVSVVWSLSEDLPCRVFESLAMGRAVVASRVPDLEECFEEGEHLEAFSGFSECLRKTVELVANPFRARGLAIAGRDQVWGSHYESDRPRSGWTARAARLCEVAGIELAPGWTALPETEAAAGRYRPCSLAS